MINHTINQERGALFVPMGMGKTSAILTALDLLHMTGHETKPALILAPLRVAQSTWPDEAAKWDHLSGMEIQPIVGTATERRAALRNKHASAFTMNYENLPWLLEELNGAWPFGMVVSDESTRLKSFAHRRWRVSLIPNARAGRTLPARHHPTVLSICGGRHGFLTQVNALAVHSMASNTVGSKRASTGTGSSLYPLPKSKYKVPYRIFA
jgi:hypothetical protein